MGNNRKRLSKRYLALVPFIMIVVGVLFGTGIVFGQSAPEAPIATATPALPTQGYQTAQVGFLVNEPETDPNVEQPMTTIEYVDRIVRIPVELRNYNDIEELKQWLADLEANTVTLYMERPEVKIDCDDFALTLQRQALADGYVMSFQIIEANRYNSLFQGNKIPADVLHAINLTVIGNNAYYIEPQTGEVVLAAQLD